MVEAGRKQPTSDEWKYYPASTTLTFQRHHQPNIIPTAHFKIKCWIPDQTFSFRKFQKISKHLHIQHRVLIANPTAQFQHFRKKVNNPTTHELDHQHSPHPIIPSSHQYFISTRLPMTHNISCQIMKTLHHTPTQHGHFITNMKCQINNLWQKTLQELNNYQ